MPRNPRPLLTSLALLAALAVAPLALSPAHAPARADDAANDQEVAFDVALGDAKLSVRIQHPKGEEPWAKVVRAHLEKGLPAIAKAAGFGPGKEHLDVRFATKGDTGGYEAALTPEALMVRKSGARYGFHGFWVMNAAARMWTEQVAKPEWLKGGLAHLLVHHALKTAPTIYEARAYRDEVLEERKKLADEAPLEQWTPAPAGSGAAVEEQPVPLPQVAQAFGFLYEIDGKTDGQIVKTAAAVAKGSDGVDKGPLSGKDFITAVGKITGQGAEGLFTGWAIPATPEVTPALDKTDIMDSDLDGLLNFEEEKLGTDKAKADSDGDRVPDGEEVEDGTNPLEKDAKRGVVKLDGDAKEWLKLKKFSMQDQEGDARRDGERIVSGGDLKFCKVACDEKYLYIMLEVMDGFTNADCTYTVAIDTGDDLADFGGKDPQQQRKIVWNYFVGFRIDMPRPWIQLTHNQKDHSWMELRNHWRLGLAVKDKVAELRIPLKAFEIPHRIMVMAYVQAKDGKLNVDSVQREVIDLDKWRN